MTKKPDFNPEDVKKVAQALLENCYTYFDYTIGCNCCGADMRRDGDLSKMQHEPSCAMLIAKDLLVGL